MKNLTIVNAILAVAVVVLFVLHFADRKSGGQITTASTEQGALTPVEGSIVYVRIDSLFDNYDMSVELRAQLEQKVKKESENIDMQVRAFERDARDFEEKVNKGLITQSQAQEKGSALQRRQQNLLELRDKTTNTLAEEQSVMSNRIQDAILKYIEVYNKDKNYSLIINTTGASTILWGNKGLDITADVLSGLNKEYVKIKGTAIEDATGNVKSGSDVK